MSQRYRPRNIGLDVAVERGQAIRIPQSGTGGGGEFGANISDNNRAYAITRIPAAYRTVFTVAHDIFDKWFQLQLEGKEDDPTSEEFDKQIQTELTRLHAKRELNKMGVFERGFGWAIIAINYEGTEDHSTEFKVPENGKYPKIEEIVAYGPTQISSVKEVNDPKNKRYKMPEIYYINVGSGKRLKIHHSRTILFNTRLLEHAWKSVSVLDPLWDYLVLLQNEMWGMGQTMYRYGSGLADITFKGREKEQIEDWVNSGAFAALNARTFFAHTEDEELDFKGTSGVALDPMNYYLPPMEHISMASGIPLAILRGAQAGALTGSEVNQLEYYGLISDEQSAYEPGIRELIDAIILSTAKDREAAAAAKGDAEEKTDYKINWFTGLTLTERGKAEIEEIKTRTLQMKGQWHTRNELREMEDPNAEPLTEEQGGNEILGKLPAGANSYHVNPNPDGTTTVTEFPNRSKRGSRR